MGRVSQTSAEEARRREAVRETLREKLDLEKRALQVEEDFLVDRGGALPLVDSHVQHLIQKRITVKKLTRGLRNIVGPLRLTLTDVSSDLNNLVRTFRLSEVSPVVREALERPTSVESILMQELPLQDQDLQSLVQLLKTIAL